MKSRTKREIDRFRAVSNDGYETTIVVYQNFIPVGTREDPDEVAPGMKEARTIDGFACNRQGDDDTFQIVNDLRHPNLIVRRVK